MEHAEFRFSLSPLTDQSHDTSTEKSAYNVEGQLF